MKVLVTLRTVEEFSTLSLGSGSFTAHSYAPFTALMTILTGVPRIHSPDTVPWVLPTCHYHGLLAVPCLNLVTDMNRVKTHPKSAHDCKERHRALRPL